MLAVIVWHPQAANPNSEFVNFFDKRIFFLKRYFFIVYQ